MTDYQTLKLKELLEKGTDTFKDKMINDVVIDDYEIRKCKIVKWLDVFDPTNKGTTEYIDYSKIENFFFNRESEFGFFISNAHSGYFNTCVNILVEEINVENNTSNKTSKYLICIEGGKLKYRAIKVSDEVLTSNEKNKLYPTPQKQEDINELLKDTNINAIIKAALFQFMHSDLKVQVTTCIVSSGKRISNISFYSDNDFEYLGMLEAYKYSVVDMIEKTRQEHNINKT
jgi:hypothetical protein